MLRPGVQPPVSRGVAPAHLHGPGPDARAKTAPKGMGGAVKARDTARDAIHDGLPDEAAQAVLRAKAAVDTLPGGGAA